MAVNSEALDPLVQGFFFMPNILLPQHLHRKCSFRNKSIICNFAA